MPPVHGPLVVSVNDVAFLHHPEAFTRHGLRFHLRALEVVHRDATAIITPSEFTRSELIRAGFDPAAVCRVPLAPSLRATHGAAPVPRLSRSPYILMVGTIEPRKNHSTVVAAFARLRTRFPELELVVAGADGWLTDPGLFRAPGIRRLGHVSDAVLGHLYEHAMAAVCASRYEGFDMTLLDALAHGCPVVASDIPVHREIGAGAAQYVDSDDSAAFASALADIVEGSCARDVLRERALSRAADFTVDAMLAGHVDVYADAASR